MEPHDLVGRVVPPGPILDYDAAGLPRGRFTLRLEDSGLAVTVETWGTHAKWVAARLFPDDRVLVVGARQPARANRTSTMVVDGVQVVKLPASAVSAGVG